MRLSIVSSLYQSEDYIEEFVDRTISVAKNFSDSYEIILVNDGSPDRTLEKAYNLASRYENLIIVNLSRNFGHHKALFAGIKQARGEYVFVLDSDLEERPEWLPELYEQLQMKTADIVYAIQSKRKGNWVERVFGTVFYKVFNKLTDLSIPANAMVARLMSRRFVHSLKSYPESTDYLPGLFAYSGFIQTTLEFDKSSKDKTSYTLRRRFTLATNAIIRFSDVPLKFILFMGVIILGVSMIAAIGFLVKALSQEVSVDSLYIILVVILGMGGLILSALGIVGLYVIHIFKDVKTRPNVIIESVYSKTPARSSSPMQKI